VDVALLAGRPTSATPTVGEAWGAFLGGYQQFVSKLDGRIDVSGVGRGALVGMMATLPDPLSALVDAGTAARLQAENQGSIGLQLSGADQDGFLITRTVPDGAADRAGVHPGDELVAVDQAPVSGSDVYRVMERLAGPVGAPVAISVRSPGETAPRTLPIQRQESRFSSYLAEARGSTQYIQIHALNSGVADQVRRSLTDPRAATATAWVLDLRGNGEGTLQEAVNTAALFVGERTVGIQEARGGRRSPLNSTGRALLNLRPLYVLIDDATAGPAELLAGALQEHGAATLVGLETAGRLGTTSGIPLADGSIAQIATGRFLTPSGARLLGSGVKPDIEVAPDGSALARGRDMQLERALAAAGE
jgi:carboxyl-terminal processing protease